MQQIEKEEMPDKEDEKQEKPKPTPQQYYATQMQDRESKMAMFKKKKEIEQQMDMLKDYKDEQMKRDFYMKQLEQSIYRSLEQLRSIE